MESTASGASVWGRWDPRIRPLEGVPGGSTTLDEADWGSPGPPPLNVVVVKMLQEHEQRKVRSHFGSTWWL